MMRSMFKNPAKPKDQPVPNQPQQATQTPTIDQASMQAEEQQRLRRRRGRWAYMFTQRQPSGDSGAVATKTLTGQ